MEFVFTVTVQVQHERGKFASREDIGDQILEALESADEGTFFCGDDGEYAITDWSISEVVG